MSQNRYPLLDVCPHYATSIHCMSELLECEYCAETLTEQGYCFNCKNWRTGVKPSPRSSAEVNPPSNRGTRRSGSASRRERAQETPSNTIERESTANSITPYLASDAEIRRLVSAVNRTTYAVRALGIWLFTSVNTFFLWNNLSNMAARTVAKCQEYEGDCGASGWDFLSWIVLSLGLSLAVYFGVKELRKSAI